MNQFTFILKDTTQKAFNSFFWFLYFLHLSIISVTIINADTYHRDVAWVTTCILILALLFFFFFKNKWRPTIFRTVLFLLMTGFWLAEMAWLSAVILIGIIIFATYVSGKKSLAVFSGENILIVKSLFKKAYSWAEVGNVVLKDHLLSVDFKNNHLIQIEISPESYAIDEATFNQFCQEQLKISKV